LTSLFYECFYLQTLCITLSFSVPLVPAVEIPTSLLELKCLAQSQ